MRIRRHKGVILVSQTGFEAQAIQRLHQHGHRVTGPRVRVIRTLSQSPRPLSAYGIHQEIIASGGKIDVVSVYRILQTLSELGLIHHIGIADGYVACSLDDTHSEDCEHLVCKICGDVTELPLPTEISDAVSNQISAEGFLIQQTKLEILAICPNCSLHA